MFSKNRNPKVKVIRINYGIFGNPDSRRIRNAIAKWVGKGYELKHQNDQRGGCFRVGHTLLTFIETPKN